MSIPYSTRLCARVLATSSSWQNLFTVPAGNRVVIKSVFSLQPVLAGNHVVIGIPGSVQLLDLYPSGVPFVSLYSSVVIHENETVGAVVYGQGTWLSMHGYLLQGAGASLTPPGAGLGGGLGAEVIPLTLVRGEGDTGGVTTDPPGPPGSHVGSQPPIHFAGNDIGRFE